MRIIGGVAAGRLLKVPPGYDVRPTPDKVRQAIFNSLGSRVDGARVLDLFAGSGALGLECLSRGAAEVLSIEKVSRHATMIRQNIQDTGLCEARHHVRVQDVFTGIKQLIEVGEAFDLILADPPFGEKNVGRRSNSDSQRLLDLEGLPNLLRPDGRVLLGHAARDTVTVPPRWAELKMMRHGDSVVRFLAIPQSTESGANPEDPTQGTAES